MQNDPFQSNAYDIIGLMMHSCVHHFIVTADRGGANANYVILYTAGFLWIFTLHFVLLTRICKVTTN